MSKPGTSPDIPAGWRSEFPILERKAYLVSHSMGAFPKRAGRYLRQYAEEWEHYGNAAWEECWIDALAAHSERVADIIHAPHGTVAMHQNVSTLMAIVISAIYQPDNPRTRIIATDLNFPSPLYNFEMYRDLGLSLELIRSPDGCTIPLELWESAIDETVLAVLADHGIFRSGFLQDAAAITRLAHAKGAYAIIDAYQTVGSVPVDVQAWNADFVLGGSHKWLCGGPGACWLYVRPERLTALEPRITGWFSHQRPFDFELSIAGRFADNFMRFITATPNIPGLYAARAGLEIIREVGVENIRNHSLRLTRLILERAEALDFKIHTPHADEQRTGMVCFDFSGAEAMYHDMLDRHIMVDYRPRCGMRVSPHFYTDENEIERFFKTLISIRIF